jgi:uncharacterized protein (TIGR02757 family)
MSSAAAATAEALDRLVTRYNRRRYVHPDPLEFLYRYPDVRDREIAGLVAASLAYGRVAQILRSVAKALAVMGPSPADFVARASPSCLARSFAGFRHRFSTGSELAALLAGARRMLDRYGSLHACFAAAFGRGDATVLPALSVFARELSGGHYSSLVSRPDGGSALKRLNLYLRWMIRHDRVDPGGWRGIPPSALVVPLDTHMHRLAAALGFTKRRQADMRTALEITAAFRAIAPRDPVRYDFALTRVGIRGDGDVHAALGGGTIVDATGTT